MSMSNQYRFDRKFAFVQHNFYPAGNPFIESGINQEGITPAICDNTDIKETAYIKNVFP
jgi:hypothetical protein